MAQSGAFDKKPLGPFLAALATHTRCGRPLSAVNSAGF
jgi:hypothetical protein